MTATEGTLPLRVVRWYRHQLAVVTLLGAVLFLLVAFRIGPTEVVISLGVGLSVVFLLFFASLLLGSDRLYNLLSVE